MGIIGAVATIYFSKKVIAASASLKIKADPLAKDKLVHYIEGPHVYTIPFSYGRCLIGKSWVVNLVDCLCMHINGQLTIQYWQWHHNIPPQMWNKIDQQSLHHAMNKIPLHWRHRVSKSMLGHFSHGKNMQR